MATVIGDDWRKAIEPLLKRDRQVSMRFISQPQHCSLSEIRVQPFVLIFSSFLVDRRIELFGCGVDHRCIGQCWSIYIQTLRPMSPVVRMSPYSINNIMRHSGNVYCCLCTPLPAQYGLQWNLGEVASCHGNCPRFLDTIPTTWINCRDIWSSKWSPGNTRLI